MKHTKDSKHTTHYAFLAVSLILFALLMMMTLHLAMRANAQEPHLVDILNGLHFSYKSVPTRTWPAGTYTVTMYAEFAGYRNENELGWYAVGTSDFNLIFSGPQGVQGPDMGYVTPPITASFTSNSEIGLCMHSPDDNGWWYTETSKNSPQDGHDHAEIYQDTTNPNLYYLGFENMAAQSGSDFDYNDMVISLESALTYPTTTATLLPTDSIGLGGSVTDTITISTSASGTLPAASGTWTLYAADNSGMTGATLIGTGSFSGALPFIPPSPSFTPTHAGTWYFQAVYSGDGNYFGSESTPADEALVVGLAPTATVTLLSPLGPITLGGSVTDKVTISTSATGTLPSATGTWTVYAADNSGMTGKVVVGSGSVSGALPFVVTSPSFTPTHAGTWYFQAVYSGDGNYVGSESTPSSEQLTVTTKWPALFVVPPKTEFDGPCVKSSTFNVDVWLFNTGWSGEDVYAVDFTLDWSSIGANNIRLVNDSIVIHSPWANYYIIKNETSPTGAKNGVLDPITDYHLSITATPPSTGLVEVNQSLVTLTFHVERDLCWPDAISGFFHLTGVKMSGDGTKAKPLTPEVDDGTYTQTSYKPNIDLTSTSATAPTTTSKAWVAEIIQKCESHQIDIEVDLTNVTNVFGFGFRMTFDPNYLELDVQKMTIKAAFPPPYETVKFTSGTGWVQLIVVRPSEKPGVCGATVAAADIIFHTIDKADGVATDPNSLPWPNNSTIHITDAIVYSKCPDLRFYTISATGSQWYPGGITGYGGSGYPVLAYGGDIKYVFRPSKYDLNIDCVVDIQDLRVLKNYYGGYYHGYVAGHGYGDLYDEGGGLVTLYDFVAIAKKFGPVDP